MTTIQQTPQAFSLGDLVVVEHEYNEYTSMNRSNEIPIYRIIYQEMPDLIYQLQNVWTMELKRCWYEQHELRLLSDVLAGYEERGLLIGWHMA